jgi:hypothetical protein
MGIKREGLGKPSLLPFSTADKDRAKHIQGLKDAKTLSCHIFYRFIPSNIFSLL